MWNSLPQTLKSAKSESILIKDLSVAAKSSLNP